MVLTRLVMILSLIFSAFPTQAEQTGLYVSQNLFGVSLRFNTGPSSVQDKTLISSETGLGYILGGWAYLGGVFNYTMVNEKTTDSGSNAVTHQETYQYYGPALGYMGESWMFIVHYYAFAEMRDNVSGYNVNPYTTNRTGSGYGVNVGYRFLFGDFELAPVISYKAISYINCKDPNSGATSACSPDVVQNDIIPYFSILFNFK
ncbi:MAG: hypothetical protein SGI74_00950 [Oligoflexia bacterium]|nr:hypothetical protein [Oligoflexia bacterium]